jgi:hypothetical protein
MSVRDTVKLTVKLMNQLYRIIASFQKSKLCFKHLQKGSAHNSYFLLPLLTLFLWTKKFIDPQSKFIKGMCRCSWLIMSFLQSHFLHSRRWDTTTTGVHNSWLHFDSSCIPHIPYNHVLIISYTSLTFSISSCFLNWEEPPLASHEAQ